MIFTYNKEFVGDVLMVIVANNEDAKLSVERKFSEKIQLKP